MGERRTNSFLGVRAAGGRALGGRAAGGRPGGRAAARPGGGPGASGDQCIRNLGLPRLRKWDLGRIGWPKVMEGLLKVEVWTEKDFLAVILK